MAKKKTSSKKVQKISRALKRKFAASFGDILNETSMKEMTKDIKAFEGWIITQLRKHKGNPNYVAKKKVKKHYA